MNKNHHYLVMWLILQEVSSQLQGHPGEMQKVCYPGEDVPVGTSPIETELMRPAGESGVTGILRKSS